jgi:transcriptional regulator GlxA family with amidase domain
MAGRPRHLNYGVETLNVGVLVFDGVEELDFVGPWEVLASTSRISPPGCRVYSVAASLETVRGAHGLRVLPDFTFQDAEPLDVLIVPGGPGVSAADRQPVVEFVRAASETAQSVASVCTGAFILERAGLLRGRRATTHFSAMDRLAGCDGVTAVAERWVDEGRIVTSGGVSAGIDMAVHLVRRLFNEQTALAVSERLELPDLGRRDAVG